MDERKPVRRASTPVSKDEWRPVQEEAILGRDIQTVIGKQLQGLYDDVVSQGVPERFAALLKKLEERDSGEE